MYHSTQTEMFDRKHSKHIRFNLNDFVDRLKKEY